MTTALLEMDKLSNNTIQIFKSNNTSLIEVASSMISSGEVKTTLAFVHKFMFALDSEEQFPININLLVEEKIYDRKDHAKRALEKYFSEGTDYQVQSLIPLQTEGNQKIWTWWRSKIQRY